MLPYSTLISNPKTLILIPSQVANGSQVANEGDEESAANESSAEPLLAPLHVTSDDDDDDDDDDSYTPTDDDDNDSYDDEKEPRRWCPELETALQHLLNMQDKANKASIKKKTKSFTVATRTWSAFTLLA